MSWIREIDQGEAEGDLGELYADIVAKRGKVANILKVHSLNPGALKTHGDLYLHLLFGRSGLSRAEREAIAVVTSHHNHCDYCIEHHFEALAKFEKDPERLQAIRTGRFEALDLRTAAMLRHAAMLTSRPDKAAEDDIERLRAAGFSDEEVLDVTLVTAYFNFVNRIALGLGVTFDEDEIRGYSN